MAIKAIDETSKELIARIEREADKVSVTVTLDGRDHHVWFATSGEGPGRESDFLLPLTLFPAMVSGSRLRLPGEVSPRLLSTVPKIQDIFGLWAAEHWGGKLQDAQRIPVDAEVGDGRGERASGVACLFSGGVDSFYTLLKHREEITHIIFVHGFDVALTDQALRAQASRMAREVAKELGKSLIEVETNVRSFSDRLVGWQEYHGAALANVGLLFQHRFRKILIPSTFNYADLAPWGSHPLLDLLWSTELTEIEHDGCERTRLDKVAYVSGHESPMEWLRVCYKNPNGIYNCGRCEKCMRTMIALRIVGAQGRCKTLPNDLDLEEVANMHIPEHSIVARRNNLKALKRLGTDPELAQAFSEAIDKSSTRNAAGASSAEIMRLEQQLSRAHEKLERTRAKLDATTRRAQRLKTRGERLAEHNLQLTAHHSAWCYRFANAAVGIALRIPKIGRLVRRERATKD